MVLPEPDSPTMPSEPPAGTENASLDEARAVEASHQLIVLRQQLIDRPEPRPRKS
ncbi:hypothetical protein GCM10009574_039170 [Streptomyces asiaticus]|uniref:Transposase n=1 Tax=Streptomyces rhizosphaericus TaxID=114699 RepID=A0ABP4ARJ9_9ACTN